MLRHNITRGFAVQTLRGKKEGKKEDAASSVQTPASVATQHAPTHPHLSAHARTSPDFHNGRNTARFFNHTHTFAHLFSSRFLKEVSRCVHSISLTCLKSRTRWTQRPNSWRAARTTFPESLMNAVGACWTENTAGAPASPVSWWCWAAFLEGREASIRDCHDWC